jgi:hypothetical protein
MKQEVSSKADEEHDGGERRRTNSNKYTRKEANQASQKGLKNVFDEAIRAVVAPSHRSDGKGSAKRKKKQCLIL